MNLIVVFLQKAIAQGIAILYGANGEIVTEKSGNLNLGVPGMMYMGGVAGLMGAFLYENSVEAPVPFVGMLIALVCALVCSGLGALIYSVLTISLRANQNVTGLALTIFGEGLSNFIGVLMISRSETKTLKLPETITAHMRSVSIPGLSDLPAAGELFFSYNPFVYLGIVIALAAGYYLHRTKTGLNVRAVGENPAAADAAGINVTRTKYVNILLGGGICGIGGAYCSMIINSGVWISDSVGGLGWIAVALVIFAGWKPGAAIAGSFLFGGLRVLKYYVPKGGIEIPIAFYDMLPFLITALVLVLGSMKKSRGAQIPASLGLNYFREER